MLEKKITIKVDKNTFQFLDSFENKSRFIRELLLDYLSDPQMLSIKLKEINKKIQENDIERVELENEKKHLEKELSAMEEAMAYRPDGYDNSVDSLLTMPDVTSADIRFQADELDVTYHDFRRMLYDDGYFHKIMGKK